ncbi:hypothetical protein CNMCM8980_009421 [Aspergillus fumigatiaffinis]|uniref:Uncharacterized protein n=1 Tax=Aspergillus fumigatiaffinis TaxID=340414 RepID=A0A8H4GLK9_9EURO|nr:hypothetical protein CNMCM6457_009553 [Aspergillus fumigatiaffinis]KAF4232963.1 hypothetical protein CNMCM6805_009586 [Aspergillus fumigatiaffinis]KAF4245735.1 hypothetical protein CNMCM8980_009421 [Aspergillus fumigatiaffinis]
MFLFRRNKKDGEETPKCEQKFKSAYKSWKSDWRYEERNSRGTLQRVDVQNKQVNPFLELEARGFAILQRRRRLKQSLGDEEDPAVPEKRPPGYITQTQREDFQRAVRELMVDYWKNAAALRKMQESWQREYGLEKLQLLRAHKDRHGRLYAWVWDQEKCADLGGCWQRRDGRLTWTGGILRIIREMIQKRQKSSIFLDLSDEEESGGDGSLILKWG